MKRYRIITVPYETETGEDKAYYFVRDTQANRSYECDDLQAAQESARILNA